MYFAHIDQRKPGLSFIKSTYMSFSLKFYYEIHIGMNERIEKQTEIDRFTNFYGHWPKTKDFIRFFVKNVSSDVTLGKKI